MKPLYINFLLLISLSEDISEDEFELFYQITQTIFKFGVNSSEYKEILENLNIIIDENFSISQINWFLDISELLENEVCKDDNARLSFFIKLLNNSKDLVIRSKIEQVQYILFNYLSDDYKQNLPNSFQVFKDNIDFSIIEDEDN